MWPTPGSAGANGGPPRAAPSLSQAGHLRTLVKAPGLWYPRVNQNTSAAFSVDRRRHLVSLVSMFGECAGLRAARRPALARFMSPLL